MSNTTDNYTLKINVESQIGEKSIRQMKSDLKDLTTQFEQAQLAGNKPLAASLAKQLGTLKNDIKDTASYLKQLDPGELLSGYVKLGQGAVGSFAAITGAMQLFGGESEKVNEVTKKAALIIQTMIGLEQFRATFIDGAGKAQIKALLETTAAQVKSLFVTKATVVATEGATVAQKGLNTAMKMNPVGLVVAGLIAAAGALIYYANKTREATAEEIAHDEQVKKNRLTMVDNVNLITQNKKAIDDLIISLKEQGKTELEKANDQIDATAKAEKDNIKKTTDATKYADQLAELNKKLEENNNKVTTNRKEAEKQSQISEELRNQIDKLKTSKDFLNEAETQGTTAVDNSVKTQKEEIKNLMAANKAKSDYAQRIKDQKQAVIDLQLAEINFRILMSQYNKDEESELEARQDLINKNAEIEINNWKEKLKTKVITLEEFQAQEKRILEIANININKLQKDSGDKSYNERVNNQKKVDQLLQDSYQNEIDDTIKKYQEVIDLSTTSEEDKVLLAKKRDEEISKIREKEVDDTKKAEEEKVKTSKEASDKIIAEEKRKTEERKAANEATIGFVADTITRTVDMIMKFMNQANEEANRNLEETYTNDKEKLDKKLKDGIVSQEQYDKQLEKLDKKKAAEKKKMDHDAWEQQKEAQLVNATIQMIMGTLAAYTAGAAVPIIGPEILGPIYAATAAAVGLAEIALIASQSNPYAKGGMINGPSHSGGGVQVNAEGGEAIVNKNSMSIPAYRNMVSAINVAGGGVPIGNSSTMNNNSNSLISASIDENTINTIVSRITSIPVVLVESDVTNSQRRVKLIESRSIIG